MFRMCVSNDREFSVRYLLRGIRPSGTSHMGYLTLSIVRIFIVVFRSAKEILNATFAERKATLISCPMLAQLMLSFGLMVTSVSLVGCSKTGLSGLVPVSGTVTYKGKPIEGADLVFNPESDGRAASAKSDASGKFHLTTLDPQDGAQPGKYKVAISKKEMINPMTAEEAEDWFHKHSGPPPPRKIKNDLPEKYADEKTSGLTATVNESGNSDLNFELK